MKQRVRLLLAPVLLLSLAGALSTDVAAQSVRIERLLDRPIIRPEMDAAMGSNIAGPSVIRVPEWLPNPLGPLLPVFLRPPGHLHPSGLRRRADRSLDHV